MAGEVGDVSMNSPRGRPRERVESRERERPISLGSSLPPSRPTTPTEAPGPFRSALHEAPPAQSISQEEEEVHDSAYLRIASFPTRESWSAFLADIQAFSSNRRIGLREMLRTHREENIHMAWISAESEDDALRIRGHYAGRQFEGRDLRLTGILESNYRDMAITAAETWNPVSLTSSARMESWSC